MNRTECVQEASMLKNTANTDDIGAANCAAGAKARAGVSIAALAARLRDDEGGNVALTFGLMVVPCMMILGSAVDLGRMLHAKNQMQGLVDNMALTAGRAVQKALAGSNYLAIAEAAAQEYWNSSKSQIAMAAKENTTGPQLAQKLTVTADSTFTKFNMKWETWVATPFISSIAILDAFMGTAAQSNSGAPSGCGSIWQCQLVTVEAQVVLQSGGNNKDLNIETSLMLDVTGSMDGQKIADLKLAAIDLIDIVVWNDQSRVTSRVALAPFAAAVNVGEAMADNVRGAYSGFLNGVSPTNTTGYKQFNFTRYNSTSQTTTFRLSKHCVTERQGTERFTDASPAVARLSPSYQTNTEYFSGSGGRCDVIDINDPEVNQVLPLTSDKSELKDRIQKFKVGGATAGQLGTAWAWYLLSPNWSSYFPTSARPGAYGDEKVKKIAVLMTDGDYNTQTWNGVWDRNANTKHANASAPNGSSQSQAETLCTNIKAKGIEVFTVGFQVSTNAKNMLKACATDHAHYYDATSGQALRMAFRDIALRISSIRLEE